MFFWLEEVTKNKLCFVFVCLSFTLIGCDEYPKDTHQILQHIRSRGVVRIGAIEQVPWAYREQGVAKGIAIELAMAFARSLGVEPQIEFLSEADATEYLRQHQIDLMVGGLTNASPCKDELGLTRTYFQTGDEQTYKHVMAVPKGENGFLVKLETFFKQQQKRIQQWWEAESRAKPAPQYEFTEKQHDAVRRSRRLEYVTLAYLESLIPMMTTVDIKARCLPDSSISYQYPPVL